MKGDQERFIRSEVAGKRKGVKLLNPSSSGVETVQHQYDAYIKMTLRGEARSYGRDKKKRAMRETTFSDLSEKELSALSTLDEYVSDYYNFSVMGYDIIVKNDLIGEALTILPKDNREIILLSYYLEMSDSEIGKLLNVVRSTVFRHRKTALKKIKEYMERKTEDENG